MIDFERTALYEIEELKQQLKEVGELLKLMYDKWENGTPCFEDPDGLDGPLGNAFQLSLEEDNQILAIIKAIDTRLERTGK